MRSFILMLLLIPTGPANADDWPRFRNSNGSASNAKATVRLNRLSHLPTDITVDGMKVLPKATSQRFRCIKNR